jgi:hypothetical protein
MKRLSITIPLMIYTLFLLSCGIKEKKNLSGNTAREQGKKDSVIIDVPKHVQDEKFQKILLHEQQLLGIESLQKGYSDLQVRIGVSHGYGPTDSIKLAIFQQKGDKVLGVFYSYLLVYDANFDSVQSIRKRVDTLVPKCGWKTFMDSIRILGVYDLPDYEKISNYYLSTDSYGLGVEVATKNTYRMYTYPNWDRMKKTIPEAMKVHQILNLIERQFDYKVYGDALRDRSS